MTKKIFLILRTYFPRILLALKIYNSRYILVGSLGFYDSHQLQAYKEGIICVAILPGLGAGRPFRNGQIPALGWSNSLAIPQKLSICLPAYLPKLFINQQSGFCLRLPPSIGSLDNAFLSFPSGHSLSLAGFAGGLLHKLFLYIIFCHRIWLGNFLRLRHDKSCLRCIKIPILTINLLKPSRYTMGYRQIAFADFNAVLILMDCIISYLPQLMK